VRSDAYSGKARRAASGSSDQSIRLWNRQLAGLENLSDKM
jgi:hypothetical protein